MSKPTITKATIATMAKACLACASTEDLYAVANGPRRKGESIAARSGSGRRAIIRAALDALPKAWQKRVADHKAGNKPLSEDDFATLANAMALAGSVVIPDLTEGDDPQTYNGTSGEPLAFRIPEDVSSAWTGETGKAPSLPSLRAMIAPKAKRAAKRDAKASRKAERQTKADARAERQASAKAKAKRKAETKAEA